MSGESDWAQNRVFRYLAERAGGKVDSISLDSPLAGFGLDPLNFVELAMEVEDERDCVLPDVDSRPMKTVADLIDYVRLAQT